MIKTWLKNQPTLLERIDVFVQILKIVSVDGKPVYMPDSYEIDRRMANQVEPDGERLEEMITKLQDVSIRHNICVDESFCLGILLFYLLSNEGKREVDFSEKLTDLIYSEAKFYEFGANQIDMTLAASEELEPYRKLGEELTSFDKDKRLSIIELQERLIDILRYIKCNVRYIDDADEENIIKTEEIRYEAFANVLSPDIEYLPAYRVVKEKKFYIRAIEVTIDVEVEANDDMHSEYKKVGFPEDTVVIVYHKSFFTVYRNSFDDATQISITLGHRAEDDLRQYIEKCITQYAEVKVLLSVPEECYELIKDKMSEMEEVNVYPESVLAARFLRECYSSEANKSILYIGIGTERASICEVEQNDNKEDIGTRLNYIELDTMFMSKIEAILREIKETCIESNEKACVISYCNKCVNDINNSERVERIKNYLGEGWNLVSGTDVLAKGAVLYADKRVENNFFNPDKEDLGIILRDIGGRVYFRQMKCSGTQYELEERLKDITTKITVWVRNNSALPHTNGMEIHGNEIRKAFVVCIESDRKVKSLSGGKITNVMLRLNFTEESIGAECKIGGANRKVNVENIKREDDFSWIKRL